MGLTKNYLASVIRGGKVVALKYINSTMSVPILMEKYGADGVELQYVGGFGFCFDDQNGVKLKRPPRVRRLSDGRIWNSADDCRHDIGVKYRTLVVAINHHTPVHGNYYEFIED